jgi:hypothetical protein
MKKVKVGDKTFETDVWYIIFKYCDWYEIITKFRYLSRSIYEVSKQPTVMAPHYKRILDNLPVICCNDAKFVNDLISLPDIDVKNVNLLGCKQYICSPQWFIPVFKTHKSHYLNKNEFSIKKRREEKLKKKSFILCKISKAIQIPKPVKMDEIPFELTKYVNSTTRFSKVNHNPEWLNFCYYIKCHCDKYNHITRNEKYVHLFQSHFVKLIRECFKNGYLPYKDCNSSLYIHRFRLGGKLKINYEENDYYTTYESQRFCKWLEKIDETGGLNKTVNEFIYS